MSDAAPPSSLLDLARRHTRGEVSPRRHQASRARVLDQLGPRRSRAWAALAVTGLVLGGGAATFAATKHYVSPTPFPGDATSSIVSSHESVPPAVSASPAEPGTVEEAQGISITVTPENATIYFDDAKLDDNPSTLKRLADNKPHRIRAEAPGYQSKTQLLLFDQDAVHFEMELKPVPMTLGPILSSGAVSNADAVIGAMRETFEGCYSEALSTNPTLAGKVTLVLRTDDSGAVTTTDAAERDGLNQKVVTCLIENVSGLEFQTIGKAGTVRIPMQFKPR